MTKTWRRGILGALAILLCGVLLAGIQPLTALADDAAAGEATTTVAAAADEPKDSGGAAAGEPVAASEPAETPVQATTVEEATPAEPSAAASEPMQSAEPASVGVAATATPANAGTVTVLADDEAPAAGKAKIGNVEYETLADAVAASVDGDTIVLGEGKYTLYDKETQGNRPHENKKLTFVGQGADKTSWRVGPPEFTDTYKGGGQDEYCDYSLDSADTITFKGMTLQAADQYKTGFARIQHLVVEDCTLNGCQHYWGYKTTIFRNCIFNTPNSEAGAASIAETYAGKYRESSDEKYAVWALTGNYYLFESCTFNAAGKAVYVYRESNGEIDQNVTIDFNDCTVNSTEASKPVLNINDVRGSFIINISGTNVINGDVARDVKKPANADHTATCSRWFGFSDKPDSNNNGKTTVTIDGTTVFTNGAMVSHEIDTANDKYTEGYKDDAYTYTYGEWEANGDGTKTREVTKVCDYCGYTETYTETVADYTLNYDANGGEGAPDSQTTTTDEGSSSFDVSGDTPTRDGYTFLGWADDPDATDVSYAAGDKVTVDSTTPKTLYAVWLKDFQVTYTDGVDGDEIFADQVYVVTSGSDTPAFDGTPTRDGYTFAGWTPEVADTVTGDATYTATWKIAASDDDDDSADDSGKKKSSSSDKSVVKTASSSAIPRTGDDGNTVLWLVMLVAAVGAAVAISRRRVLE